MARNGAAVRIGLGVVLAVAASTASAYVEVQSHPAPPNVSAMAYSPEFGMLAMNTGDTMSFVRLVDELQFGFPPFAQKYTGLSLSPSGRYLYIADYGGESNGAPSGTSWVHRYDLATGYNELKTAWIAAGNVQAVSDTRFVLASLAQPVTFTHNDWGSGSAVVPLNTPSSPPAPGYAANARPGDMRYVAATQRLIYGNDSHGQQGITAYQIAGNDFVPAETSAAQGFGGSVVLSTDGNAFYYGRLKVDAANVSHHLVVFPEIIYAATAAVAFGNGTYYDANTGQALGTLGFPTTVYALNAHGDDFWAYDAQAGRVRHFIVPAAGGAAVTVNSFGPITVSGATLVGKAIANFGNDVLIELGPIPGSRNTFAELDIDGLALGATQSLTIRSGAADQIVFLSDVHGTASTIGGLLRAVSGAGAPAPLLYVRNPAGIGVTASGGIDAPEGLALDLRSSATASGALVNQGSIGGGHKLHIAAGQIGGGGTFRGDDVSFAIEGNANNPVNPVDFLQNGLHVAPANGNGVTLRLVAFGPQAQFLNVQLLGDAVLSMAYSWPSDLPTLLPLPRNHFPAIPYAQPPIANATYGGGSLIVQAAGSLTIDGGYVNNNFVFAGGIALIAGGALDINAVQFDNGWSTNGTPFQGVFFEAPLIKSSYGNINVVTSNNQWVNFSTLPVGTAAYIQQLRPDAGGYPGYAPAENAAHLNSFSQITAIAAAGGCWICAVNTTPVTLHP